MTELKKTALYDLHRSLGAKAIPFAGYEMPVNYPLGIMKEHLYCRKSAGLFDVSHMGQLVISSNTQSMQFIASELEKLLPIDVLGLSEDRQRYGFLPNKEGGIIDDLMISNRGNHYFVVINASRKEIDFKYLKENISIGKKVGCTSLDAQKQLDINEPFYGNLFKDWSEDKYFPVYFSKEKIESATYNKTILSPN